jgi:hypothetical protein
MKIRYNENTFSTLFCTQKALHENFFYTPTGMRHWSTFLRTGSHYAIRPPSSLGRTAPLRFARLSQPRCTPTSHDHASHAARSSLPHMLTPVARSAPSCARASCAMMPAMRPCQTTMLSNRHAHE